MSDSAPATPQSPRWLHVGGACTHQQERAATARQRHSACGPAASLTSSSGRSAAPAPQIALAPSPPSNLPAGHPRPPATPPRALAGQGPRAIQCKSRQQAHNTAAVLTPPPPHTHHHHHQRSPLPPTEQRSRCLGCSCPHRPRCCASPPRRSPPTSRRRTVS